MNQYYANMKHDIGIKDKEDTNAEDIQLDVILQKLRPNTTARNFKDLLNRKDNFGRSTYWKKVTRQLESSE